MENEKLETVVARHDEQIKQQGKDIEELKDTTKVLYEMNTNIKILAMQGTAQTEKIDNIESKVEKLDKDLTEVKTKDDKEDAKKWNSLVKQIITIVVSVVIGIVLAKIGLQ